MNSKKPAIAAIVFNALAIIAVIVGIVIKEMSPLIAAICGISELVSIFFFARRLKNAD